MREGISSLPADLENLDCHAGSGSTMDNRSEVLCNHDTRAPQIRQLFETSILEK